MSRRSTTIAAVASLAIGLGVGATGTGSVGAAEVQSYIVVLERGTPDVAGVAARAARAHGGRVGFVYEHALHGFSMRMSPQAAAALARNPNVAYVETDDPVSIDVQTVPTGIQRIFADGNANLAIDGTDDFRVDVDVAVIDTGVDFEHPDLNVVGGVTCTESGGGPPWSRTASCSSGGDDDHYHGTHVAGTIAALDNGEGVVGVAPGARIHAVKVLSSSGSGSEAMVVAGIDWVAANADTIEVANMSLGGDGYSQAEDDAIQGAVNAGVAFAVAAGNSDADANDFSPAAFDNVLTVSALADFDGEPGGFGSPTCRTDQDDTLADFSNWGSAVDIAAPGVCILSTYPLEQGGYGTISGTSMASPHAAGALALLASTNDPANAIDVDTLYDQVINAGNATWTDDSGDGIHEPLLDVSDTALFAPTLVAGGGTEPEPEPDPDPADITLSVTAYKVKGVKYADLSWGGATSTNVDIDVGGSVVTTPNDGAYTDGPLGKGSGSATYQVCEAGTSTCSAEVTVTW